MSYSLVEQRRMCASGAVGMSPAGGAAKQLDRDYYWPQLLPDGQHVLHIAFEPGRGRWKACISKLDDPKSVTEIVDADSRVMYTGSP